jgi:hypothetical protein
LLKGKIKMRTDIENATAAGGMSRVALAHLLARAKSGYEHVAVQNRCKELEAEERGDYVATRLAQIAQDTAAEQIATLQTLAKENLGIKLH